MHHLRLARSLRFALPLTPPPLGGGVLGLMMAASAAAAVRPLVGLAAGPLVLGGAAGLLLLAGHDADGGVALHLGLVRRGGGAGGLALGHDEDERGVVVVAVASVVDEDGVKTLGVDPGI